MANIVQMKNMLKEILNILISKYKNRKFANKVSVLLDKQCTKLKKKINSMEGGSSPMATHLPTGRYLIKNYFIL